MLCLKMPVYLGNPTPIAVILGKHLTTAHRCMAPVAIRLNHFADMPPASPVFLS